MFCKVLPAGFMTLSFVNRMDKILITDGTGKDMNLNSAQLSVYPQIIAGMVNLLKKSRFRFSYTMLTRNHGNVLMNTRYTGTASGAAPEDPDQPALCHYQPDT